MEMRDEHFTFNESTRRFEMEEYPRGSPEYDRHVFRPEVFTVEAHIEALVEIKEDFSREPPQEPTLGDVIALYGAAVRMIGGKRRVEQVFGIPRPAIRQPQFGRELIMFDAPDNARIRELFADVDHFERRTCPVYDLVVERNYSGLRFELDLLQRKR